MIKKCVNCNDDFDTGRDGKRRKYCSQKCYREYKKKTNTWKTPFKKGHVPWNKNIKGMHLSPNTEYKKGRKSEREKPIGTESIRVDKNKKQRAYIKVGDNKWLARSHYSWIKGGNEYKKGYVIHHIDEDSLNDDLSNLCMLTRKAHINIHRRSLRYDY